MIISPYSEDKNNRAVTHHKHFDINLDSKAHADGMYYRLRFKHIDSMNTLHGVVKLASKHDCVVLNGHLSPDVRNPQTLYRRKSDYGYIMDGQNWFYLDIDGFKCKSTDINDQLNELFDTLPRPINRHSCVVQLSSSYGIDPHVLKAHLFFLMSSDLKAHEIKAGLNNMGLTKSTHPWFDPSAYNKSGVCFIADPIFDGESPYTGERVFLRSNEIDVVQVNQLDTESKVFKQKPVCQSTHYDIRQLEQPVRDKMKQNLIATCYSQSVPGNSDIPTSTIAFGLMKFDCTDNEIADIMKGMYTGSQDIRSKVSAARSKFNGLDDFSKYAIEKSEHHDKYERRRELRGKYAF